MMQKNNRIKELVELLNSASNAYYNSGKTIMDDAKFDLLMEELKALESETGIVLSNSPTHNVGTEVKTKLNKTTHDINNPMLSLDKCHSVEEVIEFAGDDDCYLSVKCDGLSTRLSYKNHRLVAASTRGDGQVGMDVLFHVKEYLNVPLEIPYDGELVIDGESVIFENDFQEINESLPEDERFANCRNLAAGTLSNLDANITKSRRMKFVAWRVIKGFKGDSNFFKLKDAETSGFTIAPMWTYTNKSDKEMLPAMLDNLKEQAHKIGLPLDGAVMAKDSISLSQSLGRTDKFFRHSIAYKYEDEVYETKLIDVEWTMGRTGQLTPTAIFKSVWIDGSEVSRASIHNVSILKNLELTKNCTVGVFKANCIIPQVRYAEKDGDEEILIPTICPVCGGPTSVKKDNASEVLVCTNPNCHGKLLGKLNNFVSRKNMNIEGLSEATLEKFISLGYINDFKSIYKLSEHKNKLILLDGFGPKSINKLLDNIEKSRDVKLENFIAALGIEGIGIAAAKTISEYFNGNYEDFINAYFYWHFDWTTLKDFGQVMADNMNTYLHDNLEMINELALEMRFLKHECKQVVNSPLNGIKFCITGSFSQSRDTLKQKLEEKGAKFVSSVSKNLDVLYCGDKAGSKLTKAQSLGVRVAYEDELMKDLGEY